MPLPLLQHIELLPQVKYSFLRRIFPLLRPTSTEPSPPHLAGCTLALCLWKEDPLVPPSTDFYTKSGPCGEGRPEHDGLGLVN